MGVRTSIYKETYTNLWFSGGGGGGSGPAVPTLDPPPVAIRNDKNKIVIESPNISTSESCLNVGEECKPVESTSIWAVICDFQECGILTSVDSDEPVQPPFKLRHSKWCSVSSLTLIEYSSD